MRDLALDGTGHLSLRPDGRSNKRLFDTAIPGRGEQGEPNMYGKGKCASRRAPRPSDAAKPMRGLWQKMAAEQQVDNGLLTPPINSRTNDGRVPCMARLRGNMVVPRGMPSE